MNITIDREQLANALTAAGRLIQKSTIELLEGVLLRCGKDQQVRLYATSFNGDMEINLGLHAQPFEFAVNAQKLALYVTRATAETIKFTMKDGEPQITLNGGNVRGKLNLLGATDFPKFSEPTTKPLFDVEFDVSRVNDVLWACGGPGNPQPYTQGVSVIAMEPGKVRVGGASQVMMCIVDLDAPDGEITKPGGVVIPQVAAKIIAHVFGKGGAGFTAHDGRAIVEAAGIRMSIPLLLREDKPTLAMVVDRVMPTMTKKTAIDRLGFLSAMQACVAMCTDKITMVKAVSDGETLRLSSTGTHGEIENEVAISCDTGMNTCFSGAKVISMLGAAKHEHLTMHAPNDQTKPHALVCGDWLAIFSPVRS